MKDITSIAGLDEMRSLPRALVFIDVNWAMQARRSDAAFHKFLSVLQHECQSEEIPVYRVDLSLQDGEVWIGIRKWLKDGGQPYDSLSYGGYGALLWVRTGIVAAYLPYLAEVECNKLMAMTRGVFELGAGSGAVDSSRLH